MTTSYGDDKRDARIYSNSRRITKSEILSDSWSREIYSVDASHYTIKPFMIACPSANKVLERAIRAGGTITGEHGDLFCNCFIGIT